MLTSTAVDAKDSGDDEDYVSSKTEYALGSWQLWEGSEVMAARRTKRLLNATEDDETQWLRKTPWETSGEVRQGCR